MIIYFSYQTGFSIYFFNDISFDSYMKIVVKTDYLIKKQFYLKG